MENVDEFLASSTQAGILKNNFSAASGFDPATEAGLLRTAQATGLPVDVLRADPDTAKRREALLSYDFNTLSTHYPKTSSFLEDPQNTAIARKDVSNMTLLEKVLSGGEYPKIEQLARSTMAGVHDLFGFTYALGSVAERYNPLSVAKREIFSRLSKAYPETPLSALNKADLEGSRLVGDIAMANYKRANEIMAKASPETLARYGNLKYFTSNADESAFLSPVKILGDALRSLPSSLALGFTAKSATSAFKYAYDQAIKSGMSEIAAKTAAMKIAGQMAAKVGAVSEAPLGFSANYLQTKDQVMNTPIETLRKEEEFTRLVEHGLNESDARGVIAERAAMISGGGAGVVDAAANLVGNRYFGRFINEGGNVFKRFGKGAAPEAITEMVQGIGEQYAQNAAIKSFVDKSQNIHQDVAEQALAGLAVGGLTGGSFSAVLGAGSHADQIKKENFFKALAQGSTENSFREMLPGKFKDLVDHYTSDGPVKNVYIDAKAFNEYFQVAGEDPARMAEKLNIPNYDEATNLTGGAVAIPISEFVAHIAPTEHLDMLMQDLKLSPMEMTGREAEQARAGEKEAYQQVVDQMDKIQTASTQEGVLNDNIQKIVEQVSQQLGTRYDKATSERLATGMRGIAVLAHREAVARAQGEGKEATPEEIDKAIRDQWGKYGLTVRANVMPKKDTAKIIGILNSIRQTIKKPSTPSVEPWDLPAKPKTFDEKMANEAIRSELSKMKAETGWAEIGGKIIRDPETGDVTGRTHWIPNYEWWPSRPDGMNEAKTIATIDKALAGEKLNANETRMIQYLLEVADERVQSGDFMPTEEELAEYELSPSDDLEAAMVARAVSIDHAAVEEIDAQYGNDDSAFMGKIKEFLNEHDKNTEAAGIGEGNQPAQETEINAIKKTIKRMGIDIATTSNEDILTRLVEVDGGQQYNQDGTLKTDTPQFKAWFGDSKVVDADGKPVVVYHGTSESFDAFDGLKDSSKKDHGFLGRGFYFSTSTNTAGTYANIKGGTSDPNIMPVFLSLQSPLHLTMTMKDTKVGLIRKSLGLPYTLSNEKVTAESAQEITDKAIELGYDGVILDYSVFKKNGVPVEKEIVVFDPTQIKSAIGNNGDYNPNDPNILHQSVFHGSPYKFDKFTLEHMGKGEGAQAYGWGLYFAGNKQIAEYYRKSLSDTSQHQTLYLNGEKIADETPERHAASLLYFNDAREIKAAAKRWLKEAKDGDIGLADTAKKSGMSSDEYWTRLNDFVQTHKRKEITVAKGQLYEATIPEDDVMLDWDKPMSQQTESIKTAIGWKDAPIPKYEIKETGRDGSWMFAAYNEKGQMIGPASATEEDARNRFLEDFSIGQKRFTGEKIYRDLKKQYGSDKAASEYLHSIGIQGIRYLDATSRNKGEGSYNYVIFDENAIDIINTFYQNEARASITLTPGAFRIDLLKDANLSSFLHEVGHFYLEVLGDMASDPNASQQIKEDYARILKWFGVASRAEITVEHHEKFARGNEAYLMEGKAPSPELRGTFARFKAWLKKIYQSLESLNVTLTDEVREVFNRIYATDAEISAAKGENQFIDLIKSQEELKLSKAEFDEYKSQNEARDGAEELAGEMMRVQRLKREAWWKEELVKEWQKVAEEVDARPEYQAFDELSKAGELRLNKDEVLLKLGEEGIKNLPRGYGNGRGNVYVENGVGIEYAAEFLNFTNGDELLKALLLMQPRKQVISAEADKRMMEKYGDILHTIAASDLAQLAMHNDARENKLAIELKALNRMLGKQAFQTEKLMREAARQIMADKKVRDVRPHDYLMAERRANKAAWKSLNDGDNIAALNHKQQELINFYLFREATKVQAEVKQLQRYAKTFESTAKRQKLGKAGEQYLEAADMLLQDVELADKSLVAIDRQKVRQWVEMQGGELYITEDMVDGYYARNWKELKVEELRAVADALRNIDHVATQQKKVMDAGKAIELDEAIAQMVESAEKNNKRVYRPDDPELKTFKQKAADWFTEWDSGLVNVRTIVAWLDGMKANGPWHRLIFNRASEAQTQYLDLMGSFGKKINDMIDAYAEARPDRLLDQFDTIFGKMSRRRIMSIAFNLGNASNIDKLVRGGYASWTDDATPQQWTIDEIMEIVGNLDKADLELIQFYWTLLDKELYPLISALEKRVNGLPLTKIEAMPITISLKTGDVTLEGGYYPMTYDRRFSEPGRKQDVGPLAGLVPEGFAYATTPKGSTKERNNFAAPALLDFNRILQRHMADVIMDITHREFLIDAQKLLRDGRVRRVIQQRVGETYEGEFNEWLKGIVLNGKPQVPLGQGERLAEAARTNATIVALGFKFSTMAVQLVGAFNAMEHPNVGAGWFLRGLGKSLSSNPVYMFGFGDAYAEVVQKSGEMRHRFETLDQSMREAQERLSTTKFGQWRDEINKAAFMGINFMDRAVTIPTWLGAYNRAKMEGMTENQAVHAADDAVVGSQGAGAAKDLTSVMRKRGLVRLFTIYMTPFAAQYNRLRTLGRMTHAKGMQYLPMAVMRALIITAIPSILADLALGRGSRKCEEGDTECLSKWTAVKMMTSISATVPFVREVGNAFEQYVEGKSSLDIKLSPVVGMIDKLGKTSTHAFETMFMDRDFSSHDAFATLESAGLVTGLPTGQLAITSEYLYDLLTDQADTETWYRDLWMRRQQK